jgi:hypothetical protein
VLLIIRIYVEVDARYFRRKENKWRLLIAVLPDQETTPNSP